MHYIFRKTYEFTARPEAVRAALLNEQMWPTLLPGLTRLGEFWRYGNELYTLNAHVVGEQIVVQAVCLAPPRRTCSIAVTLEDTLVTTRAAVAIDADVAPQAWWKLRRTLGASIAQAYNTAKHVTDETELSASVSLAARYPRTVAAFTEMNALDHLERIARLDASWETIRRPFDQGSGARDQGLGEIQSHGPTESPPSTVHRPPSTVQQSFDLIYAGGGLALLHAAVMAQRYNKRVLLFDRGEVGCAHREWNISRVELAALVESGLFSWEELRAIVMNEYERGVVRFHQHSGEATDLWMPTVLNVALDAGMLLQRARRKLEQAGGTVLDHRRFKRVQLENNPNTLAHSTAPEPFSVCVEVEAPDGTTENYRGRLLLDGMGSTSPLAFERFAGQPFAGVCPTVGTVVSGLLEGDASNEHNSQVGDILLSIDDAQRGQQYMWEGFPGRDDELTVYLFYYDTIRGQGTGNGEQKFKLSPVPRSLSPNLMQLFEDYFALLPSYKRPGPRFRHVKPVYGYIPARHSLRRQEAPLLPGVLPVGDSAAQQSPLTFCGFGSHVRNLDRTTLLLNEALRHNLLQPANLHAISAFQTNVSLHWVFSRFMQPWGRSDDVNRLQNVFLGVLHDLGIDLAQRFFQDRMRWSDYHKMVLGMFFRYPRIVLDAWQVLGWRGYRQWAGDYVRFSKAALLAWAAGRLGETKRQRLAALLTRLQPAGGLQVRAAFAEWRASGWLESKQNA